MACFEGHLISGNMHVYIRFKVSIMGIFLFLGKVSML